MTGPTARTPISHSPVVSGTNGPLSCIENRVASTPWTGGLSQYHVRRFTSSSTFAPESSANVAANSPRTTGRYLAIEPPGSSVTSKPRAVSASNGPRPWSARTRALPPPWGRPKRAYGPIRATRRAVAGSGRASPSFFSSTIARAAARRMTSRVAWSSAVTSSVPDSSAPTQAPSSRIRATSGSSSRSRTSPRSTAASRAGPRSRGGPGISRSSPARTDSTALCVPNQSLMTAPSKPHSPRSTSPISHGCSLQYVPLRRLYAVMIERTPASVTAASNGTRYSSRSVRSSISDEIVIRSSSVSLPTKCFTHAATRSRCRPRM